MINFSIGRQIDAELKDYWETKIKIEVPFRDNDRTLRYLRNANASYFYNQAQTIALTDLYYNSKFENGERDSQGKKKIFMNIGKFRSEVASKQIDIDTKDFKFTPDDYSDPWPAFFMQKDFKEYAKETYFAELINQCVDAFPKYGTVVLKKVGKRVQFVPLQNLRNEQSAICLDKASFVIEEHPDMYRWEMEDMPNWNMDGLGLKFNDKATVYERYGYVPLGWLKKVNGVADPEIFAEDFKKSVYAMVIAMKDPDPKGTNGWHIFYAAQAECPYIEAHYSRQHGRWLGIGVMEDLFENQKAKNIIVNLQRRSLQWSSKQLFQQSTTDATVKNLVKEVEDGDVLEVGVNGDIRRVDMSTRASGEMAGISAEWDRNADQKAFTYDIATGGNVPANTPATIGVILSKATNQYYDKKQEQLGQLFRHMMQEFLIPDFIRDMNSKERIVNFFSDEPGFEALKSATIQIARSQATHALLLSGTVVDNANLSAAVQPFEDASVLPWRLPKDYYKNIKYKFDFTITGEEIDVNQKVNVLLQLAQAWAQRGDPRSEQAMARIAALGGFNIDTFGQPSRPEISQTPGNQGIQLSQVQNNGNSPLRQAETAINS